MLIGMYRAYQATSPSSMALSSVTPGFILEAMHPRAHPDSEPFPSRFLGFSSRARERVNKGKEGRARTGHGDVGRLQALGVPHAPKVETACTCGRVQHSEAAASIFAYCARVSQTAAAAASCSDQRQQSQRRIQKAHDETVYCFAPSACTTMSSVDAPSFLMAAPLAAAKLSVAWWSRSSCPTRSPSMYTCIKHEILYSSQLDARTGHGSGA